MTLPNLVIAGAPKCGTSSLFNWLAVHPQVCGSTMKEPFYLMDEEHPRRRTHRNYHDYGLDGYERFFKNCKEDHKIVLEATTHYIYQETAREVLASLPTKPRIVFVLRKPSERLFSSFWYTKNNQGRVQGDISFADFVGFLRNPSTAPEGWVWGSSAYVLPRDLQYGRYVEYLCKWRESVGQDRIHIILFENLRSDPKREMVELCGWLGLDASFYDSYAFPVRNPTRSLRSLGLHRIVKALADQVRTAALKEPFKPFYFALQTRQVTSSIARSDADKALLKELDEQFRPYNERLAREFNLNLDPWD
jgi:hypothetical protein